MSKPQPHFLLQEIADHGFVNGARVVDLRCPGCGLTWEKVSHADLKLCKNITRVCDNCDALCDQAYRDAAEEIGNFRSYFSNRTRNHGIYGLRDDLYFCYLGRFHFNRFDLKKLTLDKCEGCGQPKPRNHETEDEVWLCRTCAQAFQTKTL